VFELGGTTFICCVCGDVIRISSTYELEFHQDLHNEFEKCIGIYESIWKDYDKMSNM